MTLVPARQLTVYVQSSQQWHGRSLASALVQKCLDCGIAGASVVHCVEGYGAHKHIHTARLLSLSDDLPMMVTAIDTPEQIAALLPQIADMLHDGLAVLSDVQILRPGHGAAGAT